jgi:hypothetical protein
VQLEHVLRAGLAVEPVPVLCDDCVEVADTLKICERRSVPAPGEGLGEQVVEEFDLVINVTESKDGGARF